MVRLVHFGLILLSSLGLLTISFGAQAGVLAQVSESTITENESFNLTIRSDEDSANPDFSLLSVNFDILNTQRMQQSSLTNAGRRSWVEWTLVLAPKNTGTLRIPPIQVGNDKTTAIDVKVLPISAEQKQKIKERFFVEAQVSSEQVYVEENLILTVKFYYQGSVQGAWNDVDLSSALFEPWGKDKRYQARKNGQNYRVVEQNYRIKPISPGNLYIPAFGVSGDYQANSWGKRTRFSVKSNPVKVEVKDIPASWPTSTPWLPASGIELKDSWTGLTGNISPGDNINRTITMVITNQDKSSAPKLPAPKLAQAKIYADDTQVDEQQTNEGPLTIIKENWALVPVGNADIQLPAIEVTWWNTQTDRLEVSRLPQKTISVTGSLTPNQAPSAEPVIPEQVLNVQPDLSNLTNVAVSEALDDLKGQLRTWQVITLILAVAVLFLAWQLLAVRRAAKADDSNHTPKQAKAWDQLKQHCMNNDPIAVRATLLNAVNESGQFTFKSVAELIATCQQDPLKLQLQLLDQSLFSAQGAREFNGQTFWQQIKSLPFTAPATSTDKSGYHYSTTLYGQN